MVVPLRSSAAPLLTTVLPAIVPRAVALPALRIPALMVVRLV